MLSNHTVSISPKHFSIAFRMIIIMTMIIRMIMIMIRMMKIIMTMI